MLFTSIHICDYALTSAETELGLPPRPGLLTRLIRRAAWTPENVRRFDDIDVWWVEIRGPLGDGQAVIFEEPDGTVTCRAIRREAPAEGWTCHRRPDIWSAKYDVAALDRDFAA